MSGSDFSTLQDLFTCRSASSHASRDEAPGSVQFGQKREVLARLPKYLA